ncbi:AraC family transcriptional regulator [Lapidilactobacillus luobeiensis]|uniref:AraC family transcriptional regulator n=1 Tax=Lapidilactobacillus luobeiensis TaxID=2950371 RepID=UPI0021C4AB0B|nr:AraC family transcriptional regulator [Lapidilactobacillus luobeiensis]
MLTNGADQVLLEEDLNIEHKISTDHKMDRPHFHDGFEIHFTLNDDTFYYVDERKYRGDTGAIALFNSQEIHRVVIEEGIRYERYYILFKPRFIEFAVSEYPDLLRIFMDHRKNNNNVIQLQNEDIKKITRLFDELLFLKKADDLFLQELKIKLKLIEIILFINDSVSTGNVYKNSISYNKDNEIRDITKYIKAHYSERINLEDISNEFFISKSTLVRIFKNNMGMTPNDYLSYIRIMESRKFLKRGYPVKDIAEKVGYADDSTFIKKFKKIKGLTPKQYALQEMNNDY